MVFGSVRGIEGDNAASVHAAISDYARRQAEHAHPEHQPLVAAAVTAAAARERAWQALHDTSRRRACGGRW